MFQDVPRCSKQLHVSPPSTLSVWSRRAQNSKERLFQHCADNEMSTTRKPTFTCLGSDTQRITEVYTLIHHIIDNIWYMLMCICMYIYLYIYMYIQYIYIYMYQDICCCTCSWYFSVKDYTVLLFCAAGLIRACSEDHIAKISNCVRERKPQNQRRVW